MLAVFYLISRIIFYIVVVPIALVVEAYRQIGPIPFLILAGTVAYCFWNREAAAGQKKSAPLDGHSVDVGNPNQPHAPKEPLLHHASENSTVELAQLRALRLTEELKNLKTKMSPLKDPGFGGNPNEFARRVLEDAVRESLHSTPWQEAATNLNWDSLNLPKEIRNALAEYKNELNYYASRYWEIRKEAIEGAALEGRVNEKVRELLESTFKERMQIFLRQVHQRVQRKNQYGDPIEDPKSVIEEEFNLFSKPIEEQFPPEEWNRFGESRFRFELEKRLNAYSEHKAAADRADREIWSMSPIEFEDHVARVIKDLGGQAVQTTKASRDYGADVIFSVHDHAVVVQVKHHRNPVGIKAVQEVLGAKDYYSAKEAWVVVSSSFTKEAHDLAATSRVKLFSLGEKNEIRAAIEGMASKKAG